MHSNITQSAKYQYLPLPYAGTMIDTAVTKNYTNTEALPRAAKAHEQCLYANPQGAASTLILDNGTAQAQSASYSSQGPAVYTVKDLMSILSISRPIAYELVKQSDFPAFKIGKSIRISASGLDAWMKRQSEATSWKGAN